MRLRSQLIAATLLFTFVLTVVLSLVFLSELLRERIGQTEAANDVLVHQILAATRTALQRGLKENPPAEAGEAAFAVAIEHALQTDDTLQSTLDGFVRYSSSLQDAYVSTASGRVLVSTDPSMVDAATPHRRSFATASGNSLLSKRKLLFGAPETLDVSLPLERNGQPFLVAHLGIRSTLLRNAYAPWLRDAVIVCLFALGGSLIVAAAISAVALRPIEQIGRELEVISARSGAERAAAEASASQDAVQRVSSTISRIDEQIRTSEQTRTEMATNLNSMLQTLKDGVMLFTADLRIAIASDSTANFLAAGMTPAAGTPLSEVFPPSTALGFLLSQLIAERRSVRDLAVPMDSGRTIELTLDCFPGSGMGALLTLHDVAAQEELEREIEVARRMASIGRLTAGVGHEVKNPINAMVVHLELLRGKLSKNPNADAQRHVDVLASEMSRLDRVVQTLADFSRPMEPRLQEQPLLPIVQAVTQLIAAEADRHNVAVAITEDSPSVPVRVVADAELLRQALLNIALNAMQAMPDGGVLHINLARDRNMAVLSLKDTGTGIPPERLGQIFDLYFTTKATGSGIGLAMTYRIVQLHGGVIDVSSETDATSPGRGTCFVLRLPLAARSSSKTAITGAA
ncbi:signal transduction histidine kinase involved in nitrogen fixation and metabolism regulation [Terriglobus roseus DSM 18391]|uniref:histidine kinase n=1 Tax=Terriglobus roseus (strain DSM 18391 / NRRL B-41598 / KBS 63) TaxID=926566 RepID=I3ZEF9_TERRK|nr:ATP-binding protein [Terriglobus roseus]AFL87627.1 signal transduction histidine kinase involved in nitrogen fixation and metabolism regulation [Terriglobus roseus DSM 18391]